MNDNSFESNQETTNNLTTEKLYTPKEVKIKIYKTVELCLIFTLIITICFTLIICILYKEFRIFNNEINKDDYLKYQNVINIYKENYINDFNSDKAMDYALSAVVLSSDDKYGAYFPSEDYEYKSSRLADGNYKGIGITISFDEEKQILNILKVTKNTPAERAGLEVGQTITKINGETITLERYNDLFKEIKEGTRQDIELEIDGIETITIILDTIITDKLSYEIKDNIGYIKIYTFVNETLNEFTEAIDDITSQNINKIVFDLRDNTGGDADAVIPMLDYIIDNGLIINMEYKSKETETVYANKTSKLPKDISIYLLANKHTASASELFIMSLQDHYNATLIGEQTYGKNTILTVYTLTDKSVLILSSGYYYTESHRNIEGIGISPDIELNEEELELDWKELTKYFN